MTSGVGEKGDTPRDTFGSHMANVIRTFCGNPVASTSSPSPVIESNEIDLLEIFIINVLFKNVVAVITEL